MVCDQNCIFWYVIVCVTVCLTVLSEVTSASRKRGREHARAAPGEYGIGTTVSPREVALTPNQMSAEERLSWDEYVDREVADADPGREGTVPDMDGESPDADLDRVDAAAVNADEDADVRTALAEAPPPPKWMKSWACCMNVRACPGQAYNPTPVEHVANTFSHGVGIVTSLGYFAAMLWASHRSLQLTIVVVYGSLTTLLFIMSTAYHYFEMLYRDAKECRRLRYYLHITDRTFIYLFIAASYTPWLSLRHCGLLGVNAKWVTWAFAAVGTLYQWNFHERYKRLELALYIFVAASPAVAVLTMNDWSGLDRMAVGGIIYVIGVIFFKLDGVVPFAHAIWHLHVLAASMIHAHTVLTVLLGPDKNNPIPEV